MGDCARAQSVLKKSPSEAADHQTDHGDADKRLARVRAELVVFGESTLKREPPERPLHDPSLREDLEPFHVIAPLHDLHAKPPKGAEVRHPVKERACVAAVSPY